MGNMSPFTATWEFPFCWKSHTEDDLGSDGTRKQDLETKRLTSKEEGIPQPSLQRLTALLS